MAWPAAIILAVDRLTKLASIQWLEPMGSVPVWGDFFRLTYVENPGAAFGLLRNLSEPFRTWFFGLLTLAAVVALALVYPRVPRTEPLRRLALSLVLGGALGNLWDRLTLGRVVDFLDFGWGPHRWPVFNMADSAIVVGVALLLILPAGRSPAKDVSEDTKGPLVP